MFEIQRWDRAPSLVGVGNDSGLFSSLDNSS